MATYDSVQIREIGKRIGQLSQSLNGDVKSGIFNARDGMDSLHGKTAQAMEERLTQLHSRTARLAEDFALLSRLTNDFADQLEQMDKELAEQL